MFFIIGICIAFFLEFLLLIKKNKSKADKVLAIWLLLMAIHQALFYHHITGKTFEIPHMLGILMPLPILHGVLLYFYVLEATGKKITSKISLPHLIPFCILILLLIPFFSLTGEEKIYIFRNEGIGYEWYLLIHQVSMIISGIAYTVWTLLLIRKHQKNIQTTFSNTDKKELQWLRYLSIGLGLIWVVALFFDEQIIFSCIVVFVLFIGFFGINQMNIFTTSPSSNSDNENKNPIEKEQKTELNSPEKKRYAKSGVNKEMAEEIYSKLNELMPNKNLYKQENLTLSELAKQLNVHPNHLSQVINEKEEKNFYNYINSLRIKEFIRLASQQKNEKFTLMSLAQDCGFNSKSTFNKHFKAYTQKTPSEFFREQKTAV
ncbi:helix-turn-helix domain-containing protein [Labilibaculum sp. DW002]|uniref:Helix-turn-helix domain-containing protein n=1 Tax=Paralabilibaculum antarcticum TaxID=2912572 RepID=A0ABT5VX65_9BACT|nr:helix-turn-helix domain-containing protein [Labilibaculum sp. DW002]MDE5420007.1 helix-turn-helix domain-containing protein [Labilibaculum sp. DW002]